MCKFLAKLCSYPLTQKALPDEVPMYHPRRLQRAALKLADWSLLAEHVDVYQICDHIVCNDELAVAIGDSEIVVIMRERTAAQLFARLPKLRLLVTSGMRNNSVDLAAARRHGMTVCGTSINSDPAAELTWALILGLARNIVDEATALRHNGRWQARLAWS